MAYQTLINNASNQIDLSSAQNQSGTFLPITNKDVIKYQSTFDFDFITDFDRQTANKVEQIKISIDGVEGSFEAIDQSGVYYVPKFNWENLSIIDNQQFAFWVTNPYSLYKISVGNGIDKTIDISGEYCETLAISDSLIYASGTTNVFTVEHERYLQNGTTISQASLTATTPITNGSFALIDGSFVWAIDKSGGIVKKLNKGSFTIDKTYTGLDAPFKIKKASYADTYFVAGSHFLWKIDNTSTDIKPCFSMDGKTIMDFDVSENGQLCVILRDNSGSFIKIIDSDLFSVIFEVPIDFDAQFCKYVGDNQFYALAKDGQSLTEFITNHYLFDTDSKSYSVVLSSATIDPSIEVIGVDYDIRNKKIIWVLDSGYYSIVTIPNMVVSDFANYGVSDAISMIASNENEFNFVQQTKVRVFVGTSLGRNDLWDSGVVDTFLTSMYYGGGNNLQFGSTYYVGIQTYSAYGWTDVIQKQFTVPYYDEESSSSSSFDNSSSSSFVDGENILTINNTEFKMVAPSIVTLVNGSSVSGLPTKLSSLPPGFTQLL